MRDPIVISDSDTSSEDEDILQIERDQFTKRAKVPRGSRQVASSRSIKGKARATDDDLSDESVHTIALTHDDDVNEAGPSQSPLPLSSLFGSVSERRQLELERRQRQKARRKAQGLDTDSDDDDVELDGDSQTRPTTSTTTTTNANASSRSYISEITPPRTLKPLPTRSLVRPATPAPFATHITAGLGAINGGTKPALRRILAQERFPNGIVKRSYNPHTADGVPFSDFILPTTKSNPAGLTHALIGSHVYDFDWLSTILPDRNSANAGRNADPPPTLTFLAPQQRQQQHQHQIQVGAIHAMKHPPGWAILGTPDIPIDTDMAGMHRQFLFLMYTDRFRLVILTGNLVESDWTSAGVQDNAAYIQDFHILPSGRRNTTSEMYKQLHSIMTSLAVPHAHPLVHGLARYDLSNGPTMAAATPNPSSESSANEDMHQWAFSGLGFPLGLGQCAHGVAGGGGGGASSNVEQVR